MANQASASPVRKVLRTRDQQAGGMATIGLILSVFGAASVHERHDFGEPDESSTSCVGADCGPGVFLLYPVPAGSALAIRENLAG